MEDKLIEIEEEDIIEEYKECFVIHSTKYISNQIFFNPISPIKFLFLAK